MKKKKKNYTFDCVQHTHLFGQFAWRITTTVLKENNQPAIRYVCSSNQLVCDVLKNQTTQNCFAHTQIAMESCWHILN